MHALDARAVDENLPERARFGEVLDPLGVKFQGQVGLRLAVQGLLEKVGAHGRADDVDEAPDDPVLVEALHRFEALVDLAQQLGRQLVRLAAEIGLEADLEQLGQQARDRAVAGQRLLHVGLAERDSGLPQVLAVGAQDRDLAPSQTGRDDQPVEPVVLDLAAPDAREAVVERLAHGLEVDRDAVPRHQREVVYPDRPVRPGRGHAVRHLAEHAQTHVLEHRQHVGQRHRIVGLVDLQAELGVAGLDRVVQVDAEIARRQCPVDAADVVDRGVGRKFLAVIAGERAFVAGKGLESRLLALRFDQRLLEAVGPGAASLDQTRLDLLAVVVGDAARRGLDDEVQPAQRIVAHMGVPVGDLAVEGGGEDPLEGQPQARVVAVARHEDEGGDEALERIAAQEQRDALALLQLHDAAGDLVEVVEADLEQLVARIVVEDVDQGLAGVAGRVVVGAADQIEDLLAQQRDVARRLVVGGRGEQADEQAHAVDPAVLVEALDRERIHVHRAVHGRAAVGLGQHQEVALAQIGLDFERQPAELPQAAEHRDLRIAQQAEAGIRAHLDARALALALDVHVAVAEEREVVVEQPVQEGDGLRDVARIGLGRRRRLELADQILDLVDHRPPAGDHRPHVGQHVLQVSLDLPQHAGGAALVDVDMHVGFGDRAVADLVARRQRDDAAAGVALRRELRVDEQVDGQAEVVERHGDRVDEKRHVVVDDLDDRVRRMPAVLLDARVEDPDLDLAGLALRAELPQREGRAVQIFGIGADDVLGRDVVVVVADEQRRSLRPVAGEAVLDLGDDRIDRLLLQRRGPFRHPVLSAGTIGRDTVDRPQSPVPMPLHRSGPRRPALKIRDSINTHLPGRGKGGSRVAAAN